MAVPGLRHTRQAQLLTQQELAERAGMNVATISLLETGRRKARYRSIRQLAAALGVAPTELLTAPGARVAPAEGGKTRTTT